jgi:hypothetical protein
LGVKLTQSVVTGTQKRMFLGFIAFLADFWLSVGVQRKAGMGEADFHPRIYASFCLFCLEGRAVFRQCLALVGRKWRECGRDLLNPFGRLLRL